VDRPRTQTADAEGDRSGAGRLFKRPFLALALEASHPLAGSARFGLDGVDEVILGRGKERGARRHVVGGRRVLEVALPSPALSARHARIHRDAGAWHLEDLASRNGTSLGGRRVQRAALADGDRIEAGGAFFVFRPQWPAALRAVDDLDAAMLADAPVALRTVVPELEHHYDSLRRIAPSKLSVLLLGETGTGKELLARAVHDLSGRSGSFVAVNCGALPAALVEGLLFGHKRGAFSGAVRDEPGLVRAADGGTLFLDEIGDLPLASQAALLRVLQEGEVVPLGATRPAPVDIRVVAATHRPLHALVEAGAFRSDLLARLSGYVFEAPALRARREDLGLIVASLLLRLAPERAATMELSVGAARALVEHAWPLNVREVEQAFGAILQLVPDDVIERDDLPKAIGAIAPGPPPLAGGKITGAELARLLEEHDGNVAAVGRALSRAPVQIRRWLKQFGIDADSYRRRGG
jgi:hypothetical protein